MRDVFGCMQYGCHVGGHWLLCPACLIPCTVELLLGTHLHTHKHTHRHTHTDSVTSSSCQGVNLRLTTSATKARCSFILCLNQTTFTIRSTDSQTEQSDTDSSHCIFTQHTQEQMLMSYYVFKKSCFTPTSKHDTFTDALSGLQGVNQAKHLITEISGI